MMEKSLNIKYIYNIQAMADPKVSKSIKEFICECCNLSNYKMKTKNFI